LFFKLPTNVSGYVKCGIADLQLYPPIQNLPAGAAARKPSETRIGYEPRLAAGIFQFNFKFY
jgi:hypothetical protein